jgi:hypothetical protein
MNEFIWTEVRERLNHDILRNQVLTELAAIKTAPQGSASPRLIGWLRQVGEYREFFAAAVETLDAGRLMETEVFSGWTTELKTVCRPIFKELFLTVHSICDRVADLHTRLADCEESARAFLQLVPQNRTPDRVVELERQFSVLSRGISELPRPVWAGASKSGEEH